VRDPNIEHAPFEIGGPFFQSPRNGISETLNLNIFLGEDALGPPKMLGPTALGPV
jgi:hypothetical protein